jgi:hypothetical protein
MREQRLRSACTHRREQWEGGVECLDALVEQVEASRPRHHHLRDALEHHRFIAALGARRGARRLLHVREQVAHQLKRLRLASKAEAERGERLVQHVTVGLNERVNGAGERQALAPLQLLT